MTPNEIAEWASAYIEVQRDYKRALSHPRWWAVERFMDRKTDPEESWRAILEIVSRNSPQNVIAVLAAGPLEELIARHGAKFIARVEQQSRRDAAFRYLLGGVWPQNTPHEIWNRVLAIRGEPW